MHRRDLLGSIAVLIAVGTVQTLRAQTPPVFKPEELDQILAPIALYPDSLLSQVLMAAGYPLEIVEASRWARANPALKGAAAIEAVKDKEWDASVKSLVAFPDVLAKMDEHLDWTQKLGDAMIGQEQDVADSVQRLRARAAAAGNLQSTPQQIVSTEGSGDSVQYVIVPANPEVIYVPAYDPAWAYGPWPYPAYPPVYYPFVGALARGFFWGVGFAAAGALFGGWNWHGRGNSYVNVNVNRAVNIDNHYDRNRINADGRWQHNPDHRKGVAYRDPGTRARYQPARPGVDQRAQYRGHVDNRPGGPPQPANRPAQPANRPAQVQRPTPENRGAAGGRTNAMTGANRGQQVNREAARGHAQQQRATSHAPAGGGAAAGGGGGGARAPAGGGRPAAGGGARGGRQ